MEPTPFLPGKFEVVIDISTVPLKAPESFNVNFDGLSDMAYRVSTLSYRRALSGGGNSMLNPAEIGAVSELTKHLLAARNIAEQLKAVSHRHMRVTTPLVNPLVELPEPLVKAYSYYGHFMHDGKSYMISDAQQALALHLVSLAKYATRVRVEESSEHDHEGDLEDVNFDYLSFDNDGDLATTFKMPFKRKLSRIAASILTSPNLDLDVGSGLAQDVLRCCDEEQLGRVLRQARENGYSGRELIAATPANTALEGTAHRDALRTLLEDPTITVGDGDKISARSLIALINRSFTILKRYTTDLGYKVRKCYLPKYDGGSKAQIAMATDLSLFSEFALSADEATIAWAISTCSGTRSRHMASPEIEKPVLLDSLIEKSFLSF